VLYIELKRLDQRSRKTVDGEGKKKRHFALIKEDHQVNKTGQEIFDKRI